MQTNNGNTIRQRAAIPEDGTGFDGKFRPSDKGIVVRLIAVTRIGNEADIAEAFVRHTCAIVDHHILLLDGSTDGTPEILRNLLDIGFPLTILSKTSVRFTEAETATALYKEAVDAGADWVLFLDADEFIDSRRLGTTLKDYLAKISSTHEALSCIKVQLTDYVARSSDDPAQLIVPERLTHKVPPTENWKVMVKRDLVSRDIEIQPGGHNVHIDGGQRCPAHKEQSLMLAHYPERSVFQFLAKSVIGWAKVLAAGEVAIKAGRAEHYRGPFLALVRNPAEILRNDNWVGFRHEKLPQVYDPISYLGGQLTYTKPVDYEMSAVQTVLRYLESLATQYGMLVDSDRSNLDATETRRS